jgi:hypothetical protein
MRWAGPVVRDVIAGLTYWAKGLGNLVGWNTKHQATWGAGGQGKHPENDGRAGGGGGGAYLCHANELV